MPTFANMKKRKEKFADFLLDIVKYVVTAGLLAMWFTDLHQWEWYSYVILVVGIVVFLLYGLFLYDDEDKDRH